MYFVGDPVTVTTATQPFALAIAPTVPIDPTTVTVTVKSPSGSTTYTTANSVVRVSTGVYTCTVVCDVKGRWKAVIVGSGTVEKTAFVEWDVVAP